MEKSLSVVFSCVVLCFFYVFQHTDAQCTISDEWIGEWWTEFDSANSRDLIKVITANRISIKDGTTNTELEAFQCDASSSPLVTRDWNYIVRSPEGTGTPQTCLRARPAAEDNLLVLWENVNPAPTDPTANDCSSANYEVPAQLLVRVDANANSADPECNFGPIGGKYQVTYSGASTCSGDTASTIVVSSTSMDINSCFTGTVDFQNPLKLTLQCVNRIIDNDLYLGGNGLSTNVVILSSNTIFSGRTVYYCVRIEVRVSGEPAPGRVYMSFDVTSPDKLDCSLTQTADTDGTSNGRTFLSMMMTPSDCEPDNPCLNGGTCAQNLGSFTCTCADGYTGDRCQTEINECSPSPCVGDSTCEDLVADYNCVCTTGFSGKNCEYLNPCELGPCQNGATCSNPSNGEYLCTCPSAKFTGTNCETELFCVGEVCLNGGTCNEDTDSCTCTTGFTGNTCETELFCETTTPPCNATNTEKCDEPTAPSTERTCVCKTGWGPPTCDEQLLCDPNPCMNGATCDDATGSAVCTCAVGYTGNLCETELFCEPTDPCENGATCNENNDTCSCPVGFTGSDCSETTTDCLPGQCGNGTCNPATNKCDCPAGTFGDFCDGLIDCDTLNPCQNNATCVKTPTGDQCSCPPGFYGNLCQNVIDCDKSNPCLNGGVCVSTPEGDRCSCAAGFYGTICEIAIDCDKLNPCLNNGTCVTTSQGGRCFCPPSYIGNLCEEGEITCRQVT